MTEYIVAKRIITEENTEMSERLLCDSPRQAILGNCNLTTIKQGGYVVLDFGKEIQGGIHYVSGKLSEGTKIRVVFGESVMEAMSTIGEKNATNDHAIRDMEVDVPSWGSQRLGNTGFRFVKIEAKVGNLELGCVQAVAEYRNLTYKGSFECDDELLNKIWRVGAYTVHLNMQEYLWDGIKRDRLVWVGDMHPEMNTIKYVFGDCGIISKSLDLIKNATPATEWMNGLATYTMWWIKIQRDWYYYTGNEEYLFKQKDYIKKATEHILSCINDDGTWDVGMKFVDWPSRDTPEADAGVVAMMIISLEASGEMMAHMGEGELSEKCRKTVDFLRTLSYPYKNNKQISALVSMAGMEDGKKIRDEILIKNGGHGLSTFLGYYTLQEIAKHGNIEDALDIIREYWGAMIDLGATTFWEDFDLDWIENAVGIDRIVPEGKKDIHGDFGKFCYNNFRHSLCHGWASGPTAFLSEYVLGIECVEPGYGKIRINPHLGNLSFAKGTVPTVYGDIRVSHRVYNGRVVSDVSLPEGIIRID